MALVGCDSSSVYTGNVGVGNNHKTDYVLGERFTFNNLEITLGDDYSFVKMTNSFSDYYGKDIFRMPITVKNRDKDAHSLNYFYYNVYGPEGSQIELFHFDFDDNIGNAGDLLTNAFYTKYLYFAYKGNGDYQFIFSDWFTTIKVKFCVSNGPEIVETKTEYGLNEQFTYDGFEITATGYSFTTVNNQFSEYNDKLVIRLEFSIKNTKDEAAHINRFELKAFDPTGTGIKNLDTYFNDSTWNASDLQKNASGIVALYLVYTSNGEYSINFGSYKTYLTLKFNVVQE